MSDNNSFLPQMQQEDAARNFLSEPQALDAGFRRKGSVHRNTDGDEKLWTELPANAVWMIMERLHMIDTISLSYVCKNFQHVLKQYSPSKLTSLRDGGSPWVMITGDLNKSKREFIRPNYNKRRYTIDHKDFAGASLLYSKKGWFLLSPSSNPEKLFLLHPLSGNKLLLPIVVDMPICQGQAAILVSGDTPTHVILATRDKYSITLAIASPYDQVWHKHTSGDRFVEFDYGNFEILPVAGKRAYCIDQHMQVIGFDVELLQWGEQGGDYYPIPPENCCEKIMEMDGELLRLYCYQDLPESYKKTKYYCGYRYDEDKKLWMRLGDKEISFFLAKQNFASTIPSGKVYIIHEVFENRSSIIAHDYVNPENHYEEPFGRIPHAKNWSVVMDSKPDCSWVDMDFDVVYI